MGWGGVNDYGKAHTDCENSWYLVKCMNSGRTNVLFYRIKLTILLHGRGVIKSATKWYWRSIGNNYTRQCLLENRIGYFSLLSWITFDSKKMKNLHIRKKMLVTGDGQTNGNKERNPSSKIFL